MCLPPKRIALGNWSDTNTGMPWPRAVEALSFGFIQQLRQLAVQQKGKFSMNGVKWLPFWAYVLGLLARGLLLSIYRTQLNILDLNFVSDWNCRFENPSRANNWTRTRPVGYSVNKCAFGILPFKDQSRDPLHPDLSKNWPNTTYHLQG